MSIETRETDACPYCRDGRRLDMLTLTWRPCGCRDGATEAIEPPGAVGSAETRVGPVRAAPGRSGPLRGV